MAAADQLKKDGSSVKLGAMRHYADGGLIESLKRSVGMGPAETVIEKYARQDAERAAKSKPVAPAPSTTTASARSAISDYSGMTAMQQREKAAGLKSGGPVKNAKPGGAIRGAGTGTSDSVPIMASHGEFMIKAKAVKVIGLETLEALNAIADGPDEKDSKAEKLAEYGDSESKKEDQGEGPEDAESKAEDKGEGPESAEGMKCGGKVKAMKCGGAVRKMAIGGLVTDEDRAKAVAQIPATGAVQQPFDRGGQQGTEADRMKVYQAANQKANDLVTFGQTTPTSAQALTQARQDSDAAYKNIYAPTPSAANPAAPAGLTPTPAATPALPGTPAAVSQSTSSPAGATTTVAPPAGSLPSPSQVTKTVQPNGVTSYSGAPNITGDINLPGPRGGMISAQNNQAAENLARKYGQTTGFGPAGAIRGGGQVSSMDTSAGYSSDLKQLADINAGKAAQETNMQAQADYAANKVLEGRALAGNRGALQIMGNNLRAKTDQRGQDVQADATRANYQLAQDKLKLDAAKDGRDATTAGFTNRSAGRIEALQAAYESAKPEDRGALAEQLRVMTGKERPSKYTVSRGGQVYDPKAMTMVNQPDRVFDNQSGTWIDQPGQGGGTAPLPPGMVKQVGTSGGKPVYEDSNGKRHS